MRPVVDWIRPDWPAPPPVKSVITTRHGGFSAAPYQGLNLGDHVGDAPVEVARNRAWLSRQLALPSEPHWLQQVHGCHVLECGQDLVPGRMAADAATSSQPGQVCAVLTADCLPLLICNRSGSRVAAVHAGWRGLAAGVIERALSGFDAGPGELLVWLGPAIGPAAFEVGDEVRETFVSKNPADEAAFLPSSPGHWLADIYQLARNRLAPWRPGFVGGGDDCTYSEEARFFSYRRDGITGRMAALIWIQP